MLHLKTSFSIKLYIFYSIMIKIVCHGYHTELCPWSPFRADVSNPCWLGLWGWGGLTTESFTGNCAWLQGPADARSSPLSQVGSHPVPAWCGMSMPSHCVWFPVTLSRLASSRASLAIGWRYSCSHTAGQPLPPTAGAVLLPLQAKLLKRFPSKTLQAVLLLRVLF